jgi:2-iminobutanoate/2-iminopropanoate deaminase
MTSKRGMIVPGAPPPAGPYSHLVVAGDYIYLAGQGPFDSEGQRVGVTFAEQARKTLDNLSLLAQACGASLADAVRVGVYLRDMANFAAMNEIYATYFPEPRPARTTIPSALVGFDIEIDAVLYSPIAKPSD